MNAPSFILSGHAMGPVEGDVPHSIVLFLHGLGSNGDDLISLAPYFARELPSTLFISPNAPDPCDMAPEGYPDSYQWFSLANRDPQILVGEVAAANPILDQFIDQILQHYGLPSDKLVLVGFSQGTMMSLYNAPRRKQPIAGVLGFSGALMGEAGLSAGVSKCPVLLVHGDSDDVVDCDATIHAEKALIHAGFQAESVICSGLGHSINEEGLKAGIAFVKKCLA